MVPRDSSPGHFISSHPEPARPLTWRVAASVVSLSIALPPGAALSASYDEPPLPLFADPEASMPRSPGPFRWEPPQPGGHGFLQTRGPSENPGPLAENLVITWLGGLTPAPVLFAADEPPAAPAADEPWLPGELAQNDAAGGGGVLPPPDGVPVAPVDGNPGPLPGVIDAIGNCVISGEVSDTTTLNPIGGAIVDIIGTGRTTETDPSGKFRIDGLAAGTYTLEVSKLGYSGEVSVITALEGQPAEARFGLRAKPADDSTSEHVLEEETIVGEYQGESGGDLFLDLKISPNIAAGISKEEFTKAGVSDAAGAVSKIAGANIVGGKYAVVRGLGDRYSNTLFNGALISSADPSKKAVQLDLFPSDLLESVSINKTFTPDLPAEFAGGTVLIQTLRFPDKPIVDFGVGTSWNDNLNGSDMRTVRGRSLGFFGRPGDGLPASAGELAGNGLPALPAGHTGARPPATAAQLQSAANAASAWADLHASAPMRPGRRAAEAGQSLELTLGDVYNPIGDLEIGGVFAFTWESKDQVRENVRVGRNLNPGVDLLPGTGDDFFNRTQTEDRYAASVNWGMLGSLGFRLGERHEIGLSYFKNTSAEDEVTIGRNVRMIGSGFGEYLHSSQSPFGAGAYAYQNFENISPLQRRLDVFQIDGRHEFGEEGGGPKLEWNLASSEAVEERPHSRTLYFSELDFTDPRIAGERGDVYNPGLGVVQTFPDVFSNSPPLVKSFRESLATFETADNARMDLTLPAYRRDEGNFLEFKVGANSFKRERQVRGRLFDYTISNGLNNQTLGGDGQYGVDYLEDFDSIYEPDGSLKFNGWSSVQAGNLGDKLIIREVTLSGRTVRNVDAGTNVMGTYLMGNWNIGGWGLIGGARLEKETRSYQVLPGLNSPAFVNAVPVEIESENVLPGVTLFKDFGPEKKMRTTLAWSRTIARPTFYEFAPVITEDQASGDVIEGNPDLTDTLIDNFDLRWEWAPEPASSLAVSLFHKSMTDPIAEAVARSRKTWLNGESGTLQGIELECRRQFSDEWSLSGNYTYIDSLLRYSQQIGTSGVQTIETTFEGQPSHIANVILGYDGESGYGASLIYNFTGSYLTGVPITSDSPAIRRDAFHTLDLVLTKRFQLWECDGTVKLKVGNILGQADTERVESTDLIYKSYRPGRSLGLSIDMKF